MLVESGVICYVSFFGDLSTQAWEVRRVSGIWASDLAELRGLTGASSTMSCSQE